MKAKTTKKKYAVIAIALLILLLVVYVSRIYLPIEGTVIDAETKQPIEGAVILAEWAITPTAWIGLPTTYSYKVIETISDKNGKFNINTYVLNPIVNKPEVTIYKAGYVAWSSRLIFPDRRNRTDFRWENNYTFSVERFKPGYSYDQHTSFISNAIHSSVGTKKGITEAYFWEELEAAKEREKGRKQ